MRHKFDLVERALKIASMARGGHVLEDDYPTHYLPHVGRQVMANGGMPNDLPTSFSPLPNLASAPRKPSVPSAEGRVLKPAPVEEAPVDEGVEAYHGSPHEFEEFDPAFIGTGEGAQAYGHGLYFASNPAVAQGYRSRLAGRPEIKSLTIANKKVGQHNHFDYSPRTNDNYENIQSSLFEDLLLNEDALIADPKRVQELAINKLKSKIEDYKNEWPEAVPHAERLLKDISKPNSVNLNLGETPGKMYEVRIDAHPEKHLLDWDKPIKGQQAYDAVLKHWDDKIGDPEIVAQRLGLSDESTGEDLYNSLSGAKQNQESASKMLSDIGIRGIRYLDAGSRGQDETSGSHNYVIFDPQHIKVKRRYAEGGEVPEDKDEGIVAYAFGNSIPHIEERIAKGEFPEIEGESSSGITKRNPEPAEYIEPGSIKHTHTHDETGSYISAVTRPKGKRSASIVDLYVPEEHRGKGIGKILQKSMIEQFPNLQGQVSSKIAAKSAYELGRRLAENEKASLEDIYKKIDEDSSANLWTPTKSYGGGVPSYIPEERVEDLARRLITFSYAVAPLVPRVKGTYAEGGSVDDPIASAVDTARNLSPMGFYSAAAEAASKFPQKAPIDQIVNKIKGQPNVKKEELDNANLADAFAGQRSVDPKEVARHLQASVPQISEKVYGGKPAVKYEPKALLERPKGFENTDDVYEVGPHGKPPHLIAVNGNNFDVWGPSGYHNSFDSFNDAVEYANQSIHGVEPTEYSQYTIPGGENYREVVMHTSSSGLNSAEKAELNDLYKKENAMTITKEEGNRMQSLIDKDRNTPVFHSTHWQGIDNPLVHLRMSDRDDGKTLHLEELQSDWGQEGRDEGFIGEPIQYGSSIKGYIPKGYSWNKATKPNLNYVVHQLVDPSGKIVGEGSDKIEALKKSKLKPTVPSAPYVTNTDQWVDLGLKRALMEAAKGGYDKLIWTPGEEQADRYKLSKHVKALAYDPEEKTLSYLPHTDPNYRGYIDIPGYVEPHEIKKHIGKEMAKRLLATEPHKLSGNHILEGLDLEVGKEGMQDFYDKLVPQRLNKLVAQYDRDVKVAPHSHSLKGENGEVKAHAIQITPKLREAILKGLPAFKSGGDVGYDRGGSIIKRALDVVSKLPQ